MNGRLYFYMVLLLGAAALATTEEGAHPAKWTSSMYGGFTAKSGNTDEESYRYGGKFERRNGDIYRYMLQFDGRYRKTEDQVSDSKVEVQGEARCMLDDSWFVACTLSGLHDDLRDVKYRVKFGPSVGCYLIDTDELSTDVSSGLVYIHEKTVDDVDDFIAWRLAQKLKWKLTETMDWWTSGEILVNVCELADYLVTFQTGINNRINSHFSLMVMVDNEYDNMPDGENVEKNDFEISTGVRYTF